MQHEKETQLFDQKWTDYKNTGHVEVYREHGKEKNLTKRASKACNFTAKTVISNASVTVLGLQAAGGAAGSVGGAASVVVGVEAVTTAVASFGGKLIE